MTTFNTATRFSSITLPTLTRCLGALLLIATTAASASAASNYRPVTRGQSRPSLQRDNDVFFSGSRDYEPRDRYESRSRVRDDRYEELPAPRLHRPTLDRRDLDLRDDVDSFGVGGSRGREPVPRGIAPRNPSIDSPLRAPGPQYQDRGRQYVPGRPIVPNVDDRPDAQELIARRYQDPSVLRFVSTLSPEQAVGMYGEMLELIETRHLQPPAPQALVQRGIENVIDALQNEAFLRAIPLQVMPQQYQAFEQSLSMQLQRMPIRSSEEAVAVMQMVMQAAQQQLGLPPAVVGVEFLYGAVESLDRFSTFVLPEAARATSQQLGQTGSSSATQSASISGVTMIDPSAGVGYMKLETFTASSAKEMEQALWALHQQGMQSLVLDLRGDPGGLLTSAIEVADLFLPSGTIVSTRGRTQSDNTTQTAHSEQTWKVPLVVLVDESSASASEIFAAAIQENGRGVIVGRHTFGKGTVQTLFPLHSGSAGVRLTTAKFYSPAGREMAGAGVEPDVSVPESRGEVQGDLRTDRDVQAAVTTAREQRQ